MTCNRRHGHGILRCENEDPKHVTLHHSFDAMGFRVEWDNARKPAQGLRQSGMKQGPSPKQQEDTDVSTGVMAERIFQQITEHGVFMCEGTGQKTPDGVFTITCFRSWKDPQKALDECDPCHIEPRRKGPKANRHNVFESRSRPSNLLVCCRKCHELIDGNLTIRDLQRSDA